MNEIEAGKLERFNYLYEEDGTYTITDSKEELDVMNINPEGGGLDIKALLKILNAADSRERVAAFIMSKGLATGHGETVDDLLAELGTQIDELRAALSRQEGKVIQKAVIQQYRKPTATD